MVVTRFAPSPTGFLHIGGARTALFNWLFAKHHGGRNLLRIEDTDRKRSTEAAEDAILDGLGWLGLDWDGDAVSQFARRDRHREVADELLRAGRAYRCYASADELAEMRDNARAAGSARLYDGRWRDRDPGQAPADVAPAIRLKAPLAGETAIRDLIQGEVKVANDQLDDMVLLRADGTPTYMLAVVVDDHDMEITHVIRGDDHLTNTFRQLQIYQAMDWAAPQFAHMPLLHGTDGAKLAKRHGALGVGAYREMGFLPEALNNYLLRLGWSHGDDEIISMDQAVEWFDLDGVGRGAARFDMAKLTHLNAHYIGQADDDRLVDLILPKLAEMCDGNLAEGAAIRLKEGMTGLKERAKTVEELVENAKFYVCKRPIPLNGKAAKLLDGEARNVVRSMRDRLAGLADWTAQAIEAEARLAADEAGLKLGSVAQPLRAALTGATASPGLFEVMRVLGRAETLNRLDDVASEAE